MAVGQNAKGAKRIQVCQRKPKGANRYIDLNRVYGSVSIDVPWDQEENHIPEWLEVDGAKVALFVVLYFLAGCDFLPAFYNMPFKRMFEFVVETIGVVGLFSKPVVYKDKVEEGGRQEQWRWRLDIDEGVKMLGVCYFMLHWEVFANDFLYEGAVALSKKTDVGRYPQVRTSSEGGHIRLERIQREEAVSRLRCVEVSGVTSGRGA